MTNEAIIFNRRIDLMDAGIIGTTGKMIDIETEEGNQTMLEPVEIHTYQGWQERGFQVRKGEKAIVKFPVWKHSVKKAEKPDESDQELMFMAEAAFFSPEQVQRLEAV